MGSEINYGLLITLGFILVSFCYLFIVVSTYVFDTQTGIRRNYLTVGIALFTSSFMFGCMTIADNETLIRVFWSVAFLTGSMFYPLWLNFLTGLIDFRSRFIKPLVIGAGALTINICMLIILSDDVVFIQSNLGNEFSYQGGYLFYLLFAFILILITIIIFLQLKWLRQASIKSVHSMVLKLMYLSAFVAPIAVVTELFIPIFTNRTITPLGAAALLPASVFVFYSMKRNKLFGITIANVSEYTFTSVTVPIFVLDYKNNIVLENASAVEFLGVNTIGQNISKYITIKGVTPGVFFFKSDFTEKIVSVKTVFGMRTCDMALTVDNDKYNDAICKIVVLKDLTDIYDAMAQINEQNDKLEGALHEALEASKVKSEFLAKMSHEIRTPMNAITGMTELILREDTSDIISEHTLTIKQASANLMSLINDLLDFSKVESGNLQITPVSYSLASLINDVINIIRMKVTETQIRFIVFLDSNLPDALSGDEVRIRQALINILGNAVKHTEKGYISLTVSGEIKDENTLEIMMIVEDTGSGIKPEDIDNIFTEYFQVHSGSSDTTDGVGLGLAITKGVITEMNGDITVESEYGRGSKFIIKIPQVIESPEKLAVVKNPEEKTAIIYERRAECADALFYAIDNLGIRCDMASGGEAFIDMMNNSSYDYAFVSQVQFEYNRDMILKLCAGSQLVLLTEIGDYSPVGNWINLSMPVNVITIANIFNGITGVQSYRTRDEKFIMFNAPEANVLVVDDINTNLKVVNGLLAPYSMNVDLRLSGMEAIEAVRSKRYDLVFMDHRMPEMDGIETTERIRALDDEDPYYKNLPIIALTANAVSGMKEMFLQRGFDDFMSKPIDTVMLNSVLEKWIPADKQTYISPASENDKPMQKISKEQISIEGVDVEQGISFTGGTVEYFFETLASFHTESSERFNTIRESLEAGDISLYITLVHAIKSAAASVGAEEVSHFAFELEKAGLNNDLEFITEYNPFFLESLEKLLNNIQNALISYDSSKMSVDEGSTDSGRLLAELGRLKNYLNSMDIDSVNRSIDVLAKLAQTEDEKSVVRNISHHILIFEYDDAVKLIDDFGVSG